jgi:hypothetical protein
MDDVSPKDAQKEYKILNTNNYFLVRANITFTHN